VLHAGVKQIFVLNMDPTFSVLKTSYGMSKRFAYFTEFFGTKLYRKKEKESVESGVEAIKIYYGVSTRVARKYYDLLCDLGKGNILKIKKKVGIE